MANIRSARIAASKSQVEPYLPSNYRVVGFGGGRMGHEDLTFTDIEGEDVAGWTLDGYVLPRLASGLYFGKETTR